MQKRRRQREVVDARPFIVTPIFGRLHMLQKLHNFELFIELPWLPQKVLYHNLYKFIHNFLYNVRVNIFNTRKQFSNYLKKIDDE